MKESILRSSRQQINKAKQNLEIPQPVLFSSYPFCLYKFDKTMNDFEHVKSDQYWNLLLIAIVMITNSLCWDIRVLVRMLKSCALDVTLSSNKPLTKVESFKSLFLYKCKQQLFLRKKLAFPSIIHPLESSCHPQYLIHRNGLLVAEEQDRSVLVDV